jgi:hypothetical protein
VIQLTYTIRIVQAAPAQSKLCSATDEAYSTTFLLLLLNTLKTGGMLATKLQKLQALPGLWQKKKKLGAKFVRAESVGLAQRVVQCDGVRTLQRTGGADDADDSGNYSDDSESTGPSLLAASGDSSWRKHAHKRACTRCMHAYTTGPLKTTLKHMRTYMRLRRTHMQTHGHGA